MTSARTPSVSPRANRQYVCKARRIAVSMAWCMPFVSLNRRGVTTTRANVAPATIAWLACRDGFCHRAHSALSATHHRRAQDDSHGIPKAAGVHPPTNVPGAYGAPGLPGAPLSFVKLLRGFAGMRSPFLSAQTATANLCSTGSHFRAGNCNISPRSQRDTAMKRFADLSEQEVLALAITNEEEDSRIYQGFADGLRAQYPSSAKMFDAMAQEEVKHRGMLYDLYREKFGEYLPLIRRQDVKGFVRHKPLWLMRPLGLDEVRKYAETMEFEAERFYRKAVENARDASVRQLLVELADAEVAHEHLAQKLSKDILTASARSVEDETARRMFVLQYVQPGLAGLMDGSVSTLAPLFAAAFATHNTWSTFLVGLAASIGAGISMGFAEALSDDGSLTGRGAPLVRGAVCGLMTALGGLGHALPYLIPQFWIATAIAFVVVAIELAVISWIRYRYMDTPFLQAAFQVVVGGVLVFAAGIVIGSS